MTTATEDLDGQCKHELTRRFCSLCNGREDLGRRERDLEAERVLALGGWFPSRYAGKCSDCGERFSASTPITRKKGGARNRPSPVPEYIAMCCAPTEDE